MRPIGHALVSLGLAEPPRRFKRQDVADSEMIDLLMRRYGLRPHSAFLLVDAARDGAPQAVEALHSISQRHRLGWFASVT
jgi:hypothetical protein